jgi:CheY-like chemotaxis protein
MELNPDFRTQVLPQAGAINPLRNWSSQIRQKNLRSIAMAVSKQSDLILRDLTLPKIDGEEATRRIKVDPATQISPLRMLLSGDS